MDTTISKITNGYILMKFPMETFYESLIDIAREMGEMEEEPKEEPTA